jgi:hypothetical protein
MSWPYFRPDPYEILRPDISEQETLPRFAWACKAGMFARVRRWTRVSSRSFEPALVGQAQRASVSWTWRNRSELTQMDVYCRESSENSPDEPVKSPETTLTCGSGYDAVTAAAGLLSEPLVFNGLPSIESCQWSIFDLTNWRFGPLDAQNGAAYRGVYP